MKRIKIRNIEDDNNYYLLESTELDKEETGEMLSGFLEEGEIVKMIKEGGVLATANQFLVIKRDMNNDYIDILKFDDDSEFIYL